LKQVLLQPLLLNMHRVPATTFTIFLQLQLLLQVLVAGSGVILLAALFAFKMDFDS